MPKRRRSLKREYASGHRPLDFERLASVPRTVHGPGGRTYTTRRVNAGQKDYICPACGRTVVAGSAHVVAWPNDSLFGEKDDLAQRRHWHTACWDRRLRPIY